MALINCPECNKEISSLAKACPHCGCPIYTEPETNLNNTTPPRKKKRGSALKITLLILAIVLILGSIGFFVFTKIKTNDIIIKLTYKSV